MGWEVEVAEVQDVEDEEEGVAVVFGERDQFAGGCGS